MGIAVVLVVGLFRCGFSCSFRDLWIYLGVGLAVVLEVGLFRCGFSCSFRG